MKMKIGVFVGAHTKIFQTSLHKRSQMPRADSPHKHDHWVTSVYKRKGGSLQ